MDVGAGRLGKPASSRSSCQRAICYAERVGPHKTSVRSAVPHEEPRDTDLARAEAIGIPDLPMVMDDVVARCLPAGADDFPLPTFMHDCQRVLQANPACLRWFECRGDGSLSGQPLSVY